MASPANSRRKLIHEAMGFKPKRPKSKKQTDKELAAQPKTQKTTRGERRLSYAQAYARRTTDSSRARVQALYGRSKPPTGHGGTRRLPTPVPADQVGKSKPLNPTPGPTRRRRRNLTGGVRTPNKGY